MTRLPAGADNPPSLKISHNTYEQEEKADWEFLRLSLPVTRKCFSCKSRNLGNIYEIRGLST